MDPLLLPHASSDLHEEVESDVDDDQSEFSSDEDDHWSLTASKVPHNLTQKQTGSTSPEKDTSTSPSPSHSNNTSLNTSHNLSATTNDSQADSDADENEDDQVKQETKDDNVEEAKKQMCDVEKGVRNRKSTSLTKEIVAVQTMPKTASLKKTKKAKFTQDPSARDWKLPIFSSQPFPRTRADENKRRRRKRNSFDCVTRYTLQLKADFEVGKCGLDECVFEDVGGAELSLLMAKKFTPRRILRTLCKHLWNPNHSGILTNARRRSLYESNTFGRRLRERGASAALLGTAVELLATRYFLMDFVHIWFADGTDEPGLRLSQDSFRVAVEPHIDQPSPPSTSHPPTSITTLTPHHPLPLTQTTTSSIPFHPPSTQPITPISSIPRPSTIEQPTLPPPVQPFTLTPTPPITSTPTPGATPQVDSTMILAKMLQDDRLRSRMYSDPSLLFDLCCSLGLDKRQEESKTSISTPSAITPATHVPLPATTTTTTTTLTPASPTSPSTTQSIPISPAQPIIPVCTTSPPHRIIEAAPSTQATISAPPTPKLDSPPRTAPSSQSPKLTITLTPKSSVPPATTTTSTTTTFPSFLNNPSPSSTSSSTPRSTTPSVPAKIPGKRGRKKQTERIESAPPVPAKRYHKRSKPTPPSSPPDPTPDDTTLVPIKREDDVDDSLTVRHTNAGANQSVGANTSGGNENGGKAPDLKYTVESIDLGKYEEEKITFVATVEYGKRKRLKMTLAEIIATFPPEAAQYYMDEVEKFRQGSGNSSYRSVMRRKVQD